MQETTSGIGECKGMIHEDGENIPIYKGIPRMKLPKSSLSFFKTLSPKHRFWSPARLRVIASQFTL